MKKQFLILIAVFIAFTAMSVDPVKVQPINMSATAKAQYKAALGILDSFDGSTILYTKTEINTLLSNKANVTTGVKYVAPVGATAMGIGFAASDAFVANNVYATQFYLPYSLTVNSFSFHITTGVASNTISWAIYSEDKNTKLISAQSIDATNTGVITTNVTSTVLVPGWYWIAYSNSINTIRVMALYAYGSTAFDADTRVQGTAENSAVSGVMPSTLGNISTNYLKVPIVSLNN